MTERFTTLYEQYYRMVFSICWRNTHSREQAEDLTQEVFLKVLRALPTLREGSVKAWVQVITAHVLTDYGRKVQYHLKRAPMLSLDTPDETGFSPDSLECAIDTEEEVVARDTVARILSHMSELPRMTLLLNAQGYTLREIAERTGNTFETIKSCSVRGRKTIAQIR